MMIYKEKWQGVKRLLVSFLFFASCLFSSNAMALYCKMDNKNGPVSALESLPTILIPSGTYKAGDRIWTSEVKSITVFCYASVLSSNTAIGDQLSFWFFPDGNYDNQLFAFGVEYNNVSSVGSVASKVDIPGFIIWPSASSKSPKEDSKLLSYRIFIQAKKDMVFGGGEIAGADQFYIFQIDGVKGLNNDKGKNFRQGVTGLKKIKPISCRAKINFNPASQTVKFGSMIAKDLEKGMVFKRPLAITIVREDSCQESFGIEASFDSQFLLLIDPYSVDLKNGTRLQLFNLSDSRLEKYNEFSHFAQFDKASSVTKNYEARVSLHNINALKMGKFDTSLVLRINYK